MEKCRLEIVILECITFTVRVERLNAASVSSLHYPGLV